MKESEGILRAGGYGWGTEMVIRSIERAVRRCFPGSPRLYVGDIARERGGWLKPHQSHQSGLDADIGYYYVTQATWYQRATAENLDAARTWALVRALIEGGHCGHARGSGPLYGHRPTRAPSFPSLPAREGSAVHRQRVTGNERRAVRA